MHLSDEEINDFINLYENIYQERLSIEEAREMATRLVALYEVLARPLPGEIRDDELNNEVGGV